MLYSFASCQKDDAIYIFGGTKPDYEQSKTLYVLQKINTVPELKDSLKKALTRKISELMHKTNDGASPYSGADPDSKP